MTLKERRNNSLYTSSLLLHGNGKLLDFDNPENGERIRYAQYNVRAVKDCPFRSVGCESVCYATKGNHVFPSCIESRIRSAEISKKENFSEMIDYTIRTEKESKRYKDSTMLIRVHESGDFYSIQYLRKWVKIWKTTEDVNGLQFALYTKSFPFFLMLTAEEKEIVNRNIANGRLSINFSLDDTTSTEQKIAYLECVKAFPKANTYYCTEDVESVKHDNVCDCADCAKCGTCNKGTGKTTVVKIHSATEKDLKVYRKNVRK